MKPDEHVTEHFEGAEPLQPGDAPDETVPTDDTTGQEAEGIADALLAVAMAVECQERRIKECIRRAAAAGNLALVQDLLALWMEGDTVPGRKESAA